MKKVTKELKNKYLLFNGLLCPFCDGKELSSGHISSSEQGILTQEVKCYECKETWQDVYKLVGVYK